MDPLWLNDNNITSPNISSANANFRIERLEALDKPMQIFMVCLYSLTACLALLGNITVIIVETFGKKSALNLRKFLINLAISDILLGVLSVPFAYTDFMLGRWIFPSWLCPVSQCVTLMSAFVTAFTLTIIGIERYFAMLYPLSNKNQWLSRRCNLILVIGWIIGTLFSSFTLTYTKTSQFTWENNTYYDCRGEISGYWRKVYTTASFAMTFAIPLTIQTFSYVSIGRKLLRDKLMNNQLPLRRSIRNNDTPKIIRMLLTVVIAFSICWSPIKIFMLLLAFWPDLTELTDNFTYYSYVASYFFCHWLAMSNSFVNPIIYSFMSKSFRGDLHDLLTAIGIKRKKIQSIKSRTSTQKTSF